MKEIPLSDLADFLRPGLRVFLPGSAAEPTAFLEELERAPQKAAGVHFITSFVPGINNFDLAALSPDVELSVIFMPPGGAELTQQGRLNFFPSSYFGLAQYFAHEAEFDLALVHVSPPDAQGNCSYGPGVEFNPLVAQRAKRVIGLINEQIPALKNSPTINIRDLCAYSSVDHALAGYDMGPADDVSEKIAGHIGGLIRDGDVLQVGLGKIPGQLLSFLKNHKGLSLYTGLLSDPFRELYESGACRGVHTTCVALGSKEFYDWLPSIDNIHVGSVDKTHDPATLAGLENFVAVNSAIEVDLFGQANLEILGGRQVSNVGGAADFARAAKNCLSGKSIVALPATAGKGELSRIVASLGGVCSLPRHDIDYVVTEYGVAKIGNVPAHKKAEALIRVAAPQHRAKLSP